MSTTTANPLEVLVSEGYGIYTQVTSILNSLTQTSSTPPTTTASISSSRSRMSSGTSTSSTSSISSSASSGSSSSPSPASSALDRAASTAAAASSTPSPVDGQSTGGGSGHNKLAIILGSVLGALALGLLILALLLCCRRRRRKSREGSVRHSALLPGDEEVNSWRHRDRLHDSRYSSNKELLEGGAPLMTDHPAFRGNHENPFVPVPPPPRKSAPNSRAGLTDGAIEGDDPYLMEKGTRRPMSLGEGRSRSNSGHGKALALGAGGAALGAAAMHHHNKKHNSPDGDMSKQTINRKPVPVKSVNNGEAWPYHPPPPIHDHGGIVAGTPPRQSFESSRSRPSRDAARANATFDSEYDTPPEANPEYNTPPESNTHSQHPVAAKTAAALGAGALGGAALAHHHHKKDKQQLRDSDSSDLSQDATLVAANKHNSENLRRSSDYNRYYSDARLGRGSGVHELPTDIPPTPPARERRNSALGAAAPAAAVGSYFGPPEDTRHRSGSHSRTRSRSGSSGRPVSFPEHPDDYGQFRTHSQPPIPSRSPARHSLGPSSAATSSESSDNANAYPPRPTSPPYQSKAVVGDNGYPHMNVPRRRSGGEYDYSHNGGIGPQAMPTRPGLPLHSSDESKQTSDDSTWRLSMGMPGGWQRAGTTNGTPRGSLDGWGSPVSPVGSGWEGGRTGRLRRDQLGEGVRGGYEDGSYVSGVGRAL